MVTAAYRLGTALLLFYDNVSCGYLQQLGKEWTSRKTLSVRSGGIQAMKSSDARQAVRCAYAYACALMVLGVPITVAFCHNNRLLQLGFRPLHPQKLFNDAGQHT